MPYKGLVRPGGACTAVSVNSRIMRVFRCAAGFNLRTKYKGHHNRNTQIRSTFSQDGTFLICGSDDGWVYIWTTGSGADDEKMPKQVGIAFSSGTTPDFSCSNPLDKMLAGTGVVEDLQGALAHMAHHELLTCTCTACIGVDTSFTTRQAAHCHALS